MIKINEIEVGEVAEMNNLKMYRLFSSFTPNINVDSEFSIKSGNIRVYYFEYFKKSDGTIYEESKKYKCYIVADVEGFPAFTGWLTQIARTPVDPNTNGLLDAIEATLAGLPLNVPDEYVLQSPL